MASNDYEFEYAADVAATHSERDPVDTVLIQFCDSNYKGRVNVLCHSEFRERIHRRRMTYQSANNLWTLAALNGWRVQDLTAAKIFEN